MKNLILCGLLASLVACSAPQATMVKIDQGKLVKLWESDSTLKVPESVLYDKGSNTLYVTNIDGTDPWGKDGKGSVAKVSPEGKILNPEWISGLNAPKGMGIHKGKLYVADLTDLVIIDIKKGGIEKVLPLSAAQGLNDISIAPNGTVYVSDSKSKMVYQVKNEVTEVLLRDLKGPNGVLFHEGSLYILDSGSLYQMNADHTLRLIAEGMAGGTDGIENVNKDHFIVSAWSGTIWLVNKNDGSKKVLLDTREQKINSADLGINPSAGIIYVPTFWKNSVLAYRLQ